MHRDPALLFARIRRQGRVEEGDRLAGGQMPGDGGLEQSYDALQGLVACPVRVQARDEQGQRLAAELERFRSRVDGPRRPLRPPNISPKPNRSKMSSIFVKPGSKPAPAPAAAWP